MSYPGRPSAVVAASLLIAVVGWRQSRNPRTAAFSAMMPIVVGITADLILKPLIDRRLGATEALTFPSGHTTGITSVGVVAWLTCVSSWQHRARRLGGALLLVAVVATVGASRVLLYAHYATDVVGGVLYGAAATLAAAAVLLPRPVAQPGPEASVPGEGD
ncbi:MAG: hypothetical protein QOG30_1103 [Acidimicrobiaceae bacterium]